MFGLPYTIFCSIIYLTCSEAMIVYEEYKSSCVAFFIDAVKEFVFDQLSYGKHLPDDLISKLMTYICSESGTKKFSPIAEHALDPSPVIRSFLLKQLLERFVFYLGLYHSVYSPPSCSGGGHDPKLAFMGGLEFPISHGLPHGGLL